MAETDIRIFTVVDVMSGVAVGTKSFYRLNQARKYLKRLRGGRNLGEDDVQLFEDAIRIPAAQRRGDRRTVSSPVKSRL
jgi:hypothetical protein